MLALVQIHVLRTGAADDPEQDQGTWSDRSGRRVLFAAHAPENLSESVRKRRDGFPESVHPIRLVFCTESNSTYNDVPTISF